MSRWAGVPLREHVREVTTRRGDSEAEILSVTNNGFVRSREAFDKHISAKTPRIISWCSLETCLQPHSDKCKVIALCTLKDGGA